MKMKRTALLMVAAEVGLKDPMRLGSGDAIVAAVLKQQAVKFPPKAPVKAPAKPAPVAARPAARPAAAPARPAQPARPAARPAVRK